MGGGRAPLLCEWHWIGEEAAAGRAPCSANGTGLEEAAGRAPYSANGTGEEEAAGEICKYLQN